MIIAQITDTHIRIPGKLAYRRVDTAKYLAEAVAHVNQLDPAPDVIVMTGDLVDFALPAEYEHLAALIAPLRAPVYLLPGNHDDRDPMRQGFRKHTYLPRAGRLNYTIEDGPVRIVAVDTLIPREGGGEVSAEGLAWLDRTLAAAPKKPTVVAMHHPPFRTGISFMDGHGLRDADKFAAVIARHPQVERIIAGHLHRSIQCRVGGTVATTCPSPAHQIALDLHPGATLGFAMEPPGYQLHVWYEGTGLVTHTITIGRFPGPYPFREPKGELIS
jgi:3',5'-cyclic AMP phosphodiesterase CpdA